MGKLTLKQATELRKRVLDLISAEVTDSWSGGGDPADVRILELEVKMAREELNNYILFITERRE